MEGNEEIVAATPPLRTRRDAAVAAGRYVRNRRRLAKIKHDEDAAIDKIRARAARRREPIEARQEELLPRLQIWAEAHRLGLKTIKLPYGRELRWRQPSNPALHIDGDQRRTARLLMQLPNWEEYVEIRFKKNKIKAHLSSLRKVPGLRKALRLDDKEGFTIS